MIELLVVIAIIGILASFLVVGLNIARVKARDTKRQAEITQFGRLLSVSCYVPDGGVGEYDLAPLLDELRVKYPQYANTLSVTPKDPAASGGESLYKYIVNDQGKCALYANLENADAPVTLTQITAPTAGGGTGVLQSASSGWNGTPMYFQVSN